jgi:hypothetical protein
MSCILHVNLARKLRGHTAFGRPQFDLVCAYGMYVRIYMLSIYVHMYFRGLI